MADEGNQQEAVNTQNAGESAPPSGQQSGTQTPAGESTGRPTFTGKSIPYGRFKEVVSQKNEYENRISELENRLKTQEALSQQSLTKGDNNKYFKKLVGTGMDEQMAQTFIESMQGTANEFISERVAPLEQHRIQAEVNDWADRFSRTHSDYVELEPVMYKLFQALPEKTRGYLASDPAGLELIYSHAKRLKLESGEDSKIQEGRDAAYANKGLKQAMSGNSGTAVPPGADAIKRADIRNMSVADYAKRREEILANMRQGKVS